MASKTDFGKLSKLVKGAFAYAPEFNEMKDVQDFIMTTNSAAWKKFFTGKQSQLKECVSAEDLDEIKP